MDAAALGAVSLAGAILLGSLGRRAPAAAGGADLIPATATPIVLSCPHCRGFVVEHEGRLEMAVFAELVQAKHMNDAAKAESDGALARSLHAAGKKLVDTNVQPPVIWWCEDGVNLASDGNTLTPSDPAPAPGHPQQ